ncbi:hypothetical protein CPB86DRAFT_490733 [Serendipita vermifera]|nr:hypothetical protein CPB86DRAFT_490733 [Serendipita vermifera]
MAAVEVLIGGCGSVIRLAHLMTERYNLADGILRSLIKECDLINIALGQVKAMTKSPHLMRLGTNTDLYDGFNTALDGCSGTLQAVFNEIERIGGSEMNNKRGSTWKAAVSAMTKLRFTLNNGRLRTLLNQLRTQNQALLLLLQAYSTGSTNEISTIVRSLQSDLKKIKEDANSIRNPPASSEDTRDRITCTADTDYMQSILSYAELASEISSTRLTIDESILNTNVYRRQSAVTSTRGSGDREPLMKTLPDIPEQAISNHSSKKESVEVDNRPLSPRSSPRSMISMLPSDLNANLSHSSLDTRTNAGERPESVMNADRSTIRSSEICDVVQRLRALGNEEDFHRAHNALKQSRLNREDFVRMLEELNSLGSPHDYSKSLKAIECNGAANFTLSLKFLKHFREFGNEADYSYALEALEKYSYRFSAVDNTLGALRKVAERRNNYSIAVLLLHHQNYNAKSTLKILQELRAFIPNKEDYSRVLVLFQNNQFSIKRAFKVLDHMLTFTHSMARTSWRKLTDSTFFHHSLALLERNGYDVEQTTKDLTTLQKLGKDWKDFTCLLKVLKENQFDLEITVGDINWLNPIVEDSMESMPLASILRANNYSLQVMRKRFDEISEIGGTNDFFWALNALKKNDYDFKITLDLLDRIRQLVNEPSDYSAMLGIAGRLNWREESLAILMGNSNESSAKALRLLRQNGEEMVWLDGLEQLARLNGKQYEDSLHALVQLDYNIIVTLHFINQVKDPMGCGGAHFSTTLSLLTTFEGDASVKEEIVKIMNTLGLYECSQQRLTFISSSISYDCVRMRNLLRKLLAINRHLHRSQRTALWLMRYYTGFEDFIHLMESLTTRWTTDEDRSIVLDFLETLDGDHRHLEQVIGDLQGFEKGSSLERPSVPDRALKALRRNNYKVDRTLRECRRLHAVNPRTTHWDYVLEVHAKCLYDIECTVSLLDTLNNEYGSDPFYYDVLVVHAANIRQNTGNTPNARQIISHFLNNYKEDRKGFRSRTVGMGSEHLASVIQDDKKGLYGRTHVTASR